MAERVAHASLQVAAQLGNTPAVCRASYIHPAVLNAYLASDLAVDSPVAPVAALSVDEATLLAFRRPGSTTRASPA